MKNLANKLMLLALISSSVLTANFSSASSSNFVDSSRSIINLAADSDTDEETREFWEKFRISVMPNEDPSDEAPPPKEVHPREVHPKEKTPPKEIHPKEVTPKER